MSRFLNCALILFGILQPQALAEEKSAETLLYQMNYASQNLSYELSYIFIKKNSIEPLRYMRAINKKTQVHYSHLIYLSGPAREVIRRGNEVSYIESGIEPFSIESKTIVAPLIPMLDSNIAQLSNYYDFVLMGRAREAGVVAQVVHIVPKDGQRYSYIMWVDEKSHLPLRADLVDKDGEILEQYRTLSYTISESIATALSHLDDVHLPEVLSMPKTERFHPLWKAEWVPVGFVPHNPSCYKILATQKVVESQMYSDGLFSFSIYVSDRDDASFKKQLLRQGRRTLQSVVKGSKEITVIGDIPPTTAYQIAKAISF